MRCLVVGLFGSIALLSACSDDGEPAQTDSQSAGPEGGETADDDDGDDDATATDPTATDPTNATLSDTSADGTADDGPGTTDGDTGPEPSGPCETDDDCMVIETCCSCTVGPVSDEPPECDLEPCRQSRCDEIGFEPQAQCELGSCEPVPVSCNPDVVMCDSVPPSCNEGFFPGVDPDASCWTGGCVPAEACDVVPDCGGCPEGEACVQYSTQLGPQFHCSPIPEDCNGAPSCACMSEACVAPFDSCSDGPDGISCSCPVCG